MITADAIIAAYLAWLTEFGHTGQGVTTLNGQPYLSPDGYCRRHGLPVLDPTSFKLAVSEASRIVRS